MKKPALVAAQIPDKKYFRIGEVSNMVGVDPHVLRYWETEFKNIKPHRAKSNQRLYRRKDVENLLLVKILLHDEGYTISGARRLLKEERKNGTVGAGRRMEPVGSEDRLTAIKDELASILEQLSGSKDKQE